MLSPIAETSASSIIRDQVGPIRNYRQTFTLWGFLPNEEDGYELNEISELIYETDDELLIAAGEERIEKAVIQSDPKGGDEWYTIQGKVTNPAFEIDENQYRTLPFIVKGRVTETDYKELRALLGNRLREEPSSTIWTDLLFSLLPFLLIIGLLYFLFVRQLRMAGKGALSFGKSN